MRNWNVIDYTIEDYKDDSIPCDVRLLLKFEGKDHEGNCRVEYHLGRRLKWGRLFVIDTNYMGASFSTFTDKEFPPTAWAYIEDQE